MVSAASIQSFAGLPLKKNAVAMNAIAQISDQTVSDVLRFMARIIALYSFPSRNHLSLTRFNDAQLRLPFRNGDGALPHFWQARFYDFNVYSSRKLREKLQYMHANPVERGLVKNASEWIWSSVSFYEKGETGLVRIDLV